MSRRGRAPPPHAARNPDGLVGHVAEKRTSAAGGYGTVQRRREHPRTYAGYFVFPFGPSIGYCMPFA